MSTSQLYKVLSLFLLTSSPVIADDTLVQKGQSVYTHWCAPCHAPGAQHPGTNALATKYQGEIPAVLEERPGLTPEFITQFVRNGVSVMPFFRKTEISDKDLEAIAAYLMSNNN